MNEATGTTRQDMWNLVAGISGALLLVLILAIALYLLFPALFSRRTNPYWEAVLAPLLVVFQWLGVVLPKRGPWRRYVYQPAHLAAA